MLGISGNNRAINVLGENTQATYISSSITSQNWGALSVDSGSDMKLSAINSTVRNSGKDGYGSYVIGSQTGRRPVGAGLSHARVRSDGGSPSQIRLSPPSTRIV